MPVFARAWIAALTVTTTASASTTAAPDDDDVSIMGIQLEKSTFAEAERAIGPAKRQHNGLDASGSTDFTCYVGPDQTRLFLTASVMAVDDQINGFQVLAPGAPALLDGEHDVGAVRCSTSRKLSARSATRSGLRLGAPEAQFTKLLGRPTTTEGRVFIWYSTLPATRARHVFSQTSMAVIVEFRNGVAAAIRGWRTTEAWSTDE